MSKKLRVGIIGNGSISHHHIQSYKKNPNVEVVAVCDINGERSKNYAKSYGVEKWFDNVDDMLKMEGLDAVSVCTWNNGHNPCTVKALNAGKHVLCEKPLAMSTKEALEMQAAAEKNNKVLQVGFVRRFGQNVKVFKDFEKQGLFGNIFYAKTSCIRRCGNPGGWFADKARSGGGPLIDLGVHMIDLSRFLLGCPKAISVYGVTYSKLGRRDNIKGIGRYSPMDFNPAVDKCTVEDFAAAMIRFDNGTVLEVETSFSLNVKDDSLTLEVFGDKGGAKVEPNIEIYNETCDYLTNITPIWHQEGDIFVGNFAREVNHFVDCCLNGTKCIAPAEDGVELMRILDAIYESAATGHEVIIKR